MFKIRERRVNYNINSYMAIFYDVSFTFLNRSFYIFMPGHTRLYIF
nr:MAG TPA: hypothetical protein [Caudoviricetes sp.]